MDKNVKFPAKIYLISFLAAVFGIFLIILSAYFFILAENKIQEQKYIGWDVESSNTITISGTGEIYAKPDLALTTFSVVSNAKTVADALADNVQKMNAITDFLKGQNIQDKDLKTVNFSLNPAYEWIREPNEDSAIYPNGKRVLVGYEVNQSLQVKIRDLERIGQIIEGATASGANQAGDLQFTIDQEEELQNQAREQAIEKAKIKAKELASQLGVKLVRVANFSENGYLPYYSYAKTVSAEASGAMLDAAPSISTGENKIESIVSITYVID